ncbi:MAG: rod shape-determining protein MreC [Candidatus Moranbacteria bacterium]|nr:rod shape-determining protein MreC [Candidatus Moranbacteria bacterium]MDD3964977.1 rod shape-determining protein MreC [Candidatus Moranbacteria bacterium]
MIVQRKFTETKFFRALILFCIVWVSVEMSPAWIFAPVQSVVMTVIYPVQKVFSVMAFEFSALYTFFGSIGELKDENIRLEKERLSLVVENAQYADVQRENDELRKEIGLLPREKFDLRAATVIGRDVSGMGNWISIDKGANTGMKEGMSVIVDKGIFVGRIVEVFPASARVMLLSNGESLISGVSVESEAKGIVKGEYGLGLILDMVLQKDTIKVGDTIITSGLGGDVPRGLVIGTLQNIHLSSDKLFQKATIVPPLRFDQMRYVFVIQNVF